MSDATTGWRHGKPVAVDLYSVGEGYFLDRPVALDYLRMRAAAAQDGIALVLNGAWRSNTKQTQLYTKFLAAKERGEDPAPVARPRWSNHQAGTAVDIRTAGVHAKAYDWLVANAHRFGFKRTVAVEKWHWEHRPSEVEGYEAAVDHTPTGA